MRALRDGVDIQTRQSMVPKMLALRSDVESSEDSPVAG